MKRVHGRTKRAVRVLLAASLLCVSANAFAQSAQELPAGHPAVESGDPHAGAAGVRTARMPESTAAQAQDVPPGTVLVRVIDAAGQPVVDAPVRLGMMEEGERQTPREARTDAQGTVRFDGLRAGGMTAYRLSTEHDGARFSATPFTLDPRVGQRVQLVRHAVTHDPASVLISDARLEVQFRDERLIVTQRASVVNVTALSLDGTAPTPRTFVPTNGLRFPLPEGFSAFRIDEQSMGDQRLTEDHGAALFQGSIPPAGAGEPITLVFQYHLKLRGTEVEIPAVYPSEIPVVRATVITHAPHGMRLDVAGMAQPEERQFNGQRVLITGALRQRRDDPSLNTFRVRLSNLPSSAGPERTIAALLAALFVLGSLALAIVWHRRSGASLRPDAIPAERERLLREARDLALARESGDVGPATFDRRRREIVTALAKLLSAERRPRTG